MILFVYVFLVHKMDLTIFDRLFSIEEQSLPLILSFGNITLSRSCSAQLHEIRQPVQRIVVVIVNLKNTRIINISPKVEVTSGGYLLSRGAAR